MNFNMDRDGLEEVKARIERVLDSGLFINGVELRLFEKNWADYNEQAFAVGVGSGTDALRIALTALGVGPGDEVITPAFDVAYTAQAVAAIGATNRFVDIDPKTGLMDIHQIPSVINEKTRAIIPVHLFGQMVDMFEVWRLATRFGLIVIEDAAQAHGARFDTHRPGAYSHAACYSHYPTKNLGCLGEGGSITTNIPIVAERARMLRDAGRTDRYTHLYAGVNSGLDEIQAAVLNAKLPMLDTQNYRREQAASYYRKMLNDQPAIEFLWKHPRAQSVHHLMLIRLNERAGLLRHLNQRGIPALVHYPVPTHRQPFLLVDSMDQGPFPHADRMAETILSLPLWPGISLKEQDEVIECIKEFLYGRT